MFADDRIFDRNPVELRPGCPVIAIVYFDDHEPIYARWDARENRWRFQAEFAYVTSPVRCWVAQPVDPPASVRFV